MTYEFKRASRKKSKIRLLLSGPSGSGKTYSALQIAFGLGKKIAVIDTERGSAELYSDLGEYYVLPLNPPFRTENYVEAIHVAEKEGFDVIIIDSLTHAWAGEGGILDQHDAVTGFGGNSWAAWKPITPLHARLVDTILQSSAHIISTVRSKTAYAIDNSEGKSRPVKIGQAPQQKPDMEYDYTIAFDLALNHTAMISKDRTEQFKIDYFTPCRETGERIKAWLATGAEPTPQPPRATATPAVAVGGAAGSPPKATSNGTKLAEDPGQFKGHLNDEMHCFDCGAKIDPSREGRVSWRDYGRYLCLEHLKKAKAEEAANAKPAPRPAPKPAPQTPVDTSVSRAQRDLAAMQGAGVKSTTPAAPVSSEQPSHEPAPAEGKRHLVDVCTACGTGITAGERDMAKISAKPPLCSQCLGLALDRPAQNSAGGV
jgi:hypothetical protein